MKTILVATDGSDHGDRAVKQAASLAKATGGTLTIVNVRDSRPVGEIERHFAEVEFGDQLRRYNEVAGLSDISTAAGLHAAVQKANAQSGALAQIISDRIVANAEQDAKSEGLKQVSSSSLVGDAADAILEAADKHGADLIVMGHRGLGRMQEMLLGSVSQKVLHHAKCNVLIVV